ILGIFLLHSLEAQLGHLKYRGIRLIELGPGKGTLASDIIRVRLTMPLLTSEDIFAICPKLRRVQEDLLRSKFPQVDYKWCATADEIRDEVLVDGLDVGDDVQFRLVKSSGATSPMRILKVETRYEGIEIGSSIEIAPESLRIAKHFANLICRSGGIFVAAIRRHRLLESPLEAVGEADLSADVNFGLLAECFASNLFQLTGPCTQKQFLESYGIRERLAAISGRADQKTREDLESQVFRLTNEAQMGSIYKVNFGKRIFIPITTSGIFSFILNYQRRLDNPKSNENVIMADIFNNLHGQVGKTAVAKSLTTLVEKAEISGKAYGKQWVYVARQDTLPTPSPEDLNLLDAEIESLKKSVDEKREATRQIQSRIGHHHSHNILELNSLNNSLTNEVMAKRIQELTEENATFIKRLELLRTGTRRVDPVEKAKVDKMYELHCKEWKSRKRMCKEMLDAITENLPQSPSAFMEELGMETDPVGTK
ncbi:Hop2 meiotic double strand DNA break repair, partial [Paramicrosporidium saccamoebae]